MSCGEHEKLAKTEHTPEPWRIGTPPPNGEQTIGNEKGLMVAVATTGHGVSSKANARRIVACVNACAGISTENLEDNKPLIELAMAYNVALRQRDELLAALKEAIDAVRVFHGPVDWETYRDHSPEMKRWQAAISSVKEKA